jgi:hypothetical protein
MTTGNRTEYRIHWSVPVRVRTEDGYKRSICGPGEALSFLENWPGKEGPHYLKARRECAAAVQRRVSPEVARDIFIAASIEGGVLR